MLVIGIKGHGKLTVTDSMTAAALGSGAIEVLSTPIMIALMEKTSRMSIADYLEESQRTVGTVVNIKHLAATPVGMEVTCETELIEIDRRRLVFKVACYDKDGIIGEGLHERFIVDKDKFMEKASAKLA